MNNFPNFGPPSGPNPHPHPHPAQSMPRNSINQPQQGFGMGGMPMMPYVAQPQARTNQASSAAALLGLRPSEQAYYDKLFAQADIGGNGQLTGNAIKNLFTTSKLPKPTLATIWTLADRSKRKYLDREDFYVALKLIAMAQQSLPLGLNNIKQYAEISPPQFEGIPVPVITPGVSRQSSISGAAGATSTTPFQPSLGATFFNNLGHAGAPPAAGAGAGAGAAAPTSTASTTPPATNSSQPAVDWSMNDTARVQYSTYFGQADTDQDGYVSGAEAHKFFTQSGLDNATLRQIWVMADLDKDNKLNAEEFAIAMHLALKVRKQYKLPDKLPEVLDPRLRNQPKKTPAPETHPQSSVPINAHPSHIPSNTSDDLFGFGPSSSPPLAGTRATPLNSPPLSQKSPSASISLPPAAAAAPAPATSSTSSNPLFDFDSSSSSGDPFAGMKPASVPADSSFDADFDAFPTPGASAPAASASVSTPLTTPATAPGPAVNVPRGTSTGSNASAASFDDFGFGLPASTSAPPVSLPSTSSSISNASSTTPRGMSIPPITSNATLATMSKVDQIRTASDEHAAMTRAVRDSFGQLEMANTNVGTTKDKIEALRQQTFQMRENHEMNLKQLLVVEAQHQQLQAQYEQHAATHATEESKYLEVKEKYDAAIKALNTLQDEMKQGNDHIHQWQAETIQMKAEIKNIDANMVLLEQQLQQLRSELKAVEDLKSSQQQVLQARRDQQARLLREKQDISDLLEQSQAELEALKNETTLTSAAIQQHTKAAGELKRMLAEHTEIVQSLKDTPVAQRKPVTATTNSVTDAMARLMGDAPISKSPAAAISATSTRSPTLSSVRPSPSMDSNASFSSSLSASAASPHKRQPSVTLNPGAAEEAKKMAAATAAQLAGDDDAFTFDDVPSFEGDDGSNPFGLGEDDVTEPTQEQPASKKSPATVPTVAAALQAQLTAAAADPAPAPAGDDDPFGASSFDTSHLAAATSSSDNPFGDTGLSLDSKSIDTADDPFAAAAATTSVDTDFDTGGLDDGGFGDFAADGKKKKKKDKEPKKKKRSEIAPGGASAATSPTPGSEPSAAWAQDDSEWGF